MESVEDEVMRKDERLANRTRTKRERETRIVGAAVNILYITNELGSHSLRRSIPVFFFRGRGNDRLCYLLTAFYPTSAASAH
jgi:hypothetical protein